MKPFLRNNSLNKDLSAKLQSVYYSKKYSVRRICTVNKHVRQITKLLSKSLQRMNCQSLSKYIYDNCFSKNYYCFFKSKANSKSFLVSHHQRKTSWPIMMRFQDHFQKENSPPMMMFQDLFQCI
jgi:hypothetical protein